MVTKKDNNLNVLFGLAMLLIVFLVFLGFKKENIEFTSEEIIEMVNKLIILPKDEKPTVATVTSENLIKEGGFFEGGKIGDKVLIYAKSKKAVLFDSVLKKVINIAPLNLKDN